MEKKAVPLEMKQALQKFEPVLYGVLMEYLATFVQRHVITRESGKFLQEVPEF